MSTTAKKLSVMRAKLAELMVLFAEFEAEFEDQTPDELVETGVAAEALGQKIDTIRSLCRRKGFGRRVGGRWKADIAALRQYFRKT